MRYLIATLLALIFLSACSHSKKSHLRATHHSPHYPKVVGKHLDEIRSAPSYELISSWMVGQNFVVTHAKYENKLWLFLQSDSIVTDLMPAPSITHDQSLIANECAEINHPEALLAAVIHKHRGHETHPTKAWVVDPVKQSFEETDPSVITCQAESLEE